MEQNKIPSISKYSLDAIKAFIETYNATSANEVKIKKDLEEIVSAIESRNSEAVVDCNMNIVRKYPHIVEVAHSYNLVKMEGYILRQKSLEYQMMSLYQIGHYIKEQLDKKTIETKATVMLGKVAEIGITYGIDCLEAELCNCDAPVIL